MAFAGREMGQELVLTGFRAGSLFGFLFGCVASGAGVYSYLIGEYKASNDLLIEDIYVSYLSPKPLKLSCTPDADEQSAAPSTSGLG